MSNDNGQITLSTQLTRPNRLVIHVFDAIPQFLETYPFYQIEEVEKDITRLICEVDWKYNEESILLTYFFSILGWASCTLRIYSCWYVGKSKCICWKSGNTMASNLFHRKWQNDHQIWRMMCKYVPFFLFLTGSFASLRIGWKLLSSDWLR